MQLIVRFASDADKDAHNVITCAFQFRAHAQTQYPDVVMLKAQSFYQIARKRRRSVKISRRSGRDVPQACSIRALLANLIPTWSAMYISSL
jgi:hypothetical protein